MSNPFIVGAHVAIQVQGGWRAPVSFKSAVVAKVFKSGNFTLEGSPQQWKPYLPSGYQNYWRAGETGAGNQTLRIWDDTTNAEIVEKNERAVLYRRFEAAKRIIERVEFSVEFVTGEVIEKMEAVAAALKPIPKEPT